MQQAYAEYRKVLGGGVGDLFGEFVACRYMVEYVFAGYFAIIVQQLFEGRFAASLDCLGCSGSR